MISLYFVPFKSLTCFITVLSLPLKILLVTHQWSWREWSRKGYAAIHYIVVIVQPHFMNEISLAYVVLKFLAWTQRSYLLHKDKGEIVIRNSHINSKNPVTICQSEMWGSYSALHHKLPKPKNILLILSQASFNLSHSDNRKYFSMYILPTKIIIRQF